MTCDYCREEIDQGTGPKAGTTRPLLPPYPGRPPEPRFHFSCMKIDPEKLDGPDFNKWVVWAISKSNQDRKDHQLDVRDHLDIIHRALQALPEDITEEYRRDFQEKTDGP